MQSSCPCYIKNALLTADVKSTLPSITGRTRCTHRNQPRPYPGLHRTAVLATGVPELVYGVVLLFFSSQPTVVARCSKLAFALVVLVTPANINMYINEVPFDGLGGIEMHVMTGWQHVGRALAQAILLYALWMLAWGGWSCGPAAASSVGAAAAAAAGGGGGRVKKGDSHTYDKGYKKWDSFDVDAELARIDASGHHKKGS